MPSLLGVFMRIIKSACIALVAAALAPAAFALDPGTVTHLRTEPGSVLVIRAGELFELKEGDAVFVGDRIFTRTYGSVRFSIGDCSIGLAGRQSFEVGEDACAKAPINLAATDIVAGVQIGLYGPPTEIGATPALLGLLLAGGGAAAALGGNDDDSSPASP
jgi:hypothetical protein